MIALLAVACKTQYWYNSDAFQYLAFFIGMAILTLAYHKWDD